MIKRIMSVLLRQIGDHRRCPHCLGIFVPNDSTAKAAHDLWRELKTQEDVVVTPIKVKIIVVDEDLKEHGWKPTYAKPGDAGMDVVACGSFEIPPLTSVLVPLGFRMHLEDETLVAFLMPRSGKGHKEGIVLGNLVGVIDSSYQGQVFASVWNRNPDKYVTIKRGDYIAQLVVMPVTRVSWEEVDDFTASERGEGGFGHSR